MGHMGKVISEIRNERNMSRKDLAEGICSEKYIYFIENGQRTPSAEVVRMLSDRFGEDLTEYYKFLECEEPVRVSNTIKKLSLCQRKHKFIETQKILDDLADSRDFKKAPWCYIYEGNLIACRMFNHGEYQESIDRIHIIFENIEEQYRVSVYALTLYIELSTCNLILGNAIEAKKVAEEIEQIVARLYESSFDHAGITGKINLLTIYYNTQEYDKAIKIGEDVLQFQNGCNAYDRIQYTLGFLAFSYYQKGNYEKAFLYLNKSLLIILYNHNWTDTFEVTSQKMFLKMIEDERVNQNLLKEYKTMFGNN